ARNQLQTRWLAARLLRWLNDNGTVRLARGGVPQGTLVLRDRSGVSVQALLGAVGLTSEGLGLVPGNPLNLIHSSESADEAGMLAQWFESKWATLPDTRGAMDELLRHITALATHRDPNL